MNSDNTEASLSERHFGMDEAYSVLSKAKKNSDKVYLTDLFKVFHLQ